MAPSSPPPSNDDALLARLNALKKSSVSFDTALPASTITSSSPQPSDDLAARFARLGSASPSASPQLSRTTSANDTKIIKAPSIAPGAPSYLEGVAEGIGGGNSVEFNEEDEKSLEELLGELQLGGTEKPSWDLKEDEEKDVGRMLKDIKTLLPDVQKAVAEGKKQDTSVERRRQAGNVVKKEGEESADWENVEFDIGSCGVNVGSKGKDNNENEPGTNKDEDDGNKKPTEDQEAEDIIARVMAEIAISKKYGDLEEPSAQEEPDPSVQKSSQAVKDEKQPASLSNATNKSTTSTADEDSSLTLPSAPTTLPDPEPDDDFSRTQAIEDALTARFASLSSPDSRSPGNSLGLPSAPSFAPAKKPPKVTSSNLPKFTDEEIESWCIICNDDATLKCLGCDGDLYCQNCWMEGHRGEAAGYEERRHKAVLYTKDKGEKREKVAAS